MSEFQGAMSLRRLFAFLALGGILAGPARAVEIDGSARLWISSIDANGVESDDENQIFRFGLSQELTPWLTLFGSFRTRSFRTRFEQQPAFERTSEEPEIGLAYDRPGLNARLFFSDRAVRTSDESQNLDIRSFLASLDWRPTRGPTLGMRYQDSTSTADVVLVGRDTETQNLDLRLDYSRPAWNARYSYGLTKIANNVTGLDLDQSRHELRTGYVKRLWQDRWSVILDARYAEVDQTQEAPAGSAVALPVPVVQGLFAIDSTPSLGALDPTPGLIDGDTTTPAAPDLEIGGANTFRNIGVNLGVNRAISALEITVDAPSGPILWQVWESPDNSSWFQVSSTVSTFDAGFLRYTIRFPETTNRYFKAVNSSVNPIQEVAVTEIRALLATAQLERAEADGSEYWLTLQSSVRPNDRLEVALIANLRRDQDLVATELQRSVDERGLSAQLRWELTDEWRLRLGYRISELDEAVAPVLNRREDVATAILEWEPLETVDVMFTAQQREETGDGRPVSSTDSLTLRAALRLFPELELISTLGSADTVDDLFGFTQKSFFWIEGIEARPTDRWLVSATLSRYDFDSTGRIAVRRRSGAQVRAAWFATPFLSLSGEWLWGRDDLDDTLTQRFGVQWSPGPKLSLSTSYYDTSSDTGAGTSSLTFDGSYRLNRWLQLWLALNEAKTSLGTLEASRTEALRLGVNAIF